MDYFRQQMYEKCKKHLNYHLIFQTSDNRALLLLDGLLEDVDNENATVLVPEDVAAGETMPPSEVRFRQAGVSTYEPRYRRYSRRFIPLASITALYLYPYYYPYYPNYYPKPYPYHI